MNKSNTLPILVTRSLLPDQLEYAFSLGLAPLIVPAIQAVFPPINHSLIRQTGMTDRPIWVFTSRNGVEGFLRSVQSSGLVGTPERVYAVGQATAEVLRAAGYDPNVPLQQDAVGLAELILEDLGQAGATIIHWCGNRRRPELGERLQRMKVGYVPVEVYRTELHSMKLPQTPVSAILFYSPSAVEAFRKSGGFSGALPELFAIGHTTAELLSLESGAHVHVPVQPATETLLELVADVLGSRGNTERKLE